MDGSFCRLLSTHIVAFYTIVMLSRNNSELKAVAYFIQCRNNYICTGSRFCIQYISSEKLSIVLLMEVKEGTSVSSASQ